MIRRVLGQRRRAFAGVVAVTLVALAVGVAQALAGGTGTATSPLEKNKETCGAEAGLSVIGSVTFTRIDKTTLRTALRLQKFSPSTKHNVYVIGGPGCGASTFVGTVKTDSDGQANATFTSSTNGYESFWVFIAPQVPGIEGESVTVKVDG